MPVNADIGITPVVGDLGTDVIGAETCKICSSLLTKEDANSDVGVCLRCCRISYFGVVDDDDDD